MDKSGIENPSKSAVIGRCGGEEKTIDHAEPTKVKCLNHLLLLLIVEYGLIEIALQMSKFPLVLHKKTLIR